MCFMPRQEVQFLPDRPERRPPGPPPKAHAVKDSKETDSVDLGKWEHEIFFLMFIGHIWFSILFESFFSMPVIWSYTDFKASSLYGQASWCAVCWSALHSQQVGGGDAQRKHPAPKGVQDISVLRRKGRVAAPLRSCFMRRSTASGIGRNFESSLERICLLMSSHRLLLQRRRLEASNFSMWVKFTCVELWMRR